MYQVRPWLYIGIIEKAKILLEAMPHPELWESLRGYYNEKMTFLEMWQHIK